MTLGTRLFQSNMATDYEELKSIISTFRAITNRPEAYLNPTADLAKDTAHIVKILFDFAKRDEAQGSRRVNTCPLQELLIENFDDEQIWQEIELQNEPLLATLTREVRSVEGKKRKITVLQPNSSFACTDELSHEKKRRRYHENQDKDVDDHSVEIDQEFSSEEEVTAEQGDADEDLNDEMYTHNTQKLKQRYVVDDSFFKLADMLEFLDKEDRKYEQAQAGKKAASENSEEDDESVDLFAEIESEEELGVDNEGWDDAVHTTAKLMGRNTLPKRPHLKVKPAAELKYADFFDPPEDMESKQRKKKQADGEEEGEDNKENHEEEESEEEESEEEEDMDEEINAAASDENESDDKSTIKDSESVSTFEKSQEKLKQNIEKLEKANLSVKSWQMSGETSSKVRPMNSLLAEDLDFDHTTVAAPAITEETTQDLESMVKQRIKDEAWDDVERKTKPTVEPYEYKKRKPLDQEKSKLSLSQIYEQEYLKQTQDETEEKESEEHTAIKALMSKLFVKLDALSNFHFTPKPIKPEFKVVTNAPAISMEEVAPVAVSDAMLLAPEEIQEKTPEVKGSSEKTTTDRKHERRLKKKKQRMRAKEKEKRKVGKGNPDLDSKFSKQAAMKRLEKETKSGSGNVSIMKEGSGRDLATSSAFFSRLQDEVKEQLKKKTDMKKKKVKSKGTSALGLKL